MTKAFGKAYLKLQRERKGTLIQRQEKLNQQKLKLKNKNKKKRKKLKKKQNEKRKRTSN